MFAEVVVLLAVPAVLKTLTTMVYEFIALLRKVSTLNPFYKWLNRVRISEILLALVITLNKGIMMK